MLGEAVGVGGGRLDEDILAVEAEAFVCDFCGGDFEGAEGFDGVYEELVCGMSAVWCVAEYMNGWGRTRIRPWMRACEGTWETHTLDLHGHEKAA